MLASCANAPSSPKKWTADNKAENENEFGCHVAVSNLNAALKAPNRSMML